MFFNRRALPLAAALLALTTTLGCEEAGDRITSLPQHDVAITSITVSDIEQLYAAVNNVVNAGAAITLTPGTYVLSSHDPAAAPRSNGGRLELQHDMSLYGVTDDRSAVVIDASGLPASSVSVPFGRTAPVRIGRGSNTIEWLTVLGNAAMAGGIATELGGTSDTRIRVAHVVSGGTSRGIDVRNVGSVNGGRRIDAEIIDNEFIGPSSVVGMTEGIRIANFVGADGGVIVARLAGNRTHGFQLGCIFANNRSNGASIYVHSSGDQFFANALACQIAGGLSQAATGTANSNLTVFESYGTAFVDNTAQIPGFDRGGVRIAGGLSTTQSNVASYNTVRVALWGTRVSDNAGINFEANGALMRGPAGFAGTNNHVTIDLHGVSKRIDVLEVPSIPTEPAGTNTVTVIR
jgi:hypothetical protein